MEYHKLRLSYKLVSGSDILIRWIAHHICVGYIYIQHIHTYMCIDACTPQIVGRPSSVTGYGG